MRNVSKAMAVSILTMGLASPAPALTDCDELPSWEEAKAALDAARGESNGGFNLDMWISIVNRDGEVCAVAYTGENRGDQWPGSRVISAQKANTANAFSLPGLALSTANLWAATQPGGSLFGLQFSNPVDATVAYGGNKGQPFAGSSNPGDYGTEGDPLVGQFVGGVNVFGGGLAMYTEDGTLLGALGVSGDSSCADHNIAYRARDVLGLDYVPGGVNSVTGDDNIIYDVTTDSMTGLGVSASGFGHPNCNPDNTGEVANEVVVAACPSGDGATEGCTGG